MRPTRSLPLVLVLIASTLLVGCSEKAARITGNERLLRGIEGLGTTSRSDTLVDRDTYVPPTGTSIKGATLLVGRQGPYEARSLLRPTAWTLPDTANPALVIDSVLFRIEFDVRVNENLPAGGTLFTLYEAGATWDTTGVQWPGPALGASLGSGPDGLAPFTINLGPSAFTLIRIWAAQGESFPGFVLTLDSGQGVRGYLAGTGRIEIVSHVVVGASTKVTTRLPTDLTINSPILPATGVEDTLALGGLNRTAAIFRAPVSPPPAGFSINGADFVAHIQSPAFPLDENVEVRIYRIRNSWNEGGIAADSVLGLDATALTVLSAYRVRTSGDSLVIPIPPAVAREWSLNDASNQGVLVRVTDSFYAPEILLFSRESASPPYLRVSTTTPPPGRF